MQTPAPLASVSWGVCIHVFRRPRHFRSPVFLPSRRKCDHCVNPGIGDSDFCQVVLNRLQIRPRAKHAVCAEQEEGPLTMMQHIQTEFGPLRLAEHALRIWQVCSHFRCPYPALTYPGFPFCFPSRKRTYPEVPGLPSFWHSVQSQHPTGSLLRRP